MVQILEKRASHNGSSWSELPEGTYHTLVALSPNTVILGTQERRMTYRQKFLDAFQPRNTAAKQLVETWEGYF